MQRDVEVPPLRAIPQVRLGPGLLGCADHGGIHGRGRGSQGVDEARALLAGRVQRARRLGCVGQRASRAHDEVLDDVSLLARTHRREERVRLDALQDDRADASHLRRGHRRTRGLLVRTVRYRRENLATGRRNLGLETQVRGHTPRGKFRRLVDGGLRQDLPLGDREHVLRGVQHGLAVGLRDERGGHVLRRQVHGDERSDRHVVVDDDSGGLEVVEVLDLLLVGHVAARDEGNLAGETVRVLRLERGGVLLGGEPGVHVLVGAGGQVGEEGDLLTVEAASALISDVFPIDGEGVAKQGVFDRGDGNHRGVGRRLVHDRGVGVRGVGQALAGVVAVPGGEGVARGRVDGDARFLQLLVHGRVHRVGLAIHAGRPAERQVNDVGMQDEHVVEGGEQRGVQQRVVLAARHLRDNHLGVRSGTDDLVGVTCGDAGDMRPVGTVRGLRRRRVVVSVRVVVGEGELLRHEDAGLALTQLRGHRGDLLRGERGRSRELASKCRMRHVNARVDDGNDLSFALLRDLVDVHHEMGAQVSGVLPAGLRGLDATLGIGRGHITDAPLALEERGTYASGTADRVERTDGCLEGEAGHDVVILVLHLGLRSWVEGGHSLVDLTDRTLTGRAILELDDDADDARGVRLCVGRGGRGLPALRGQRRVDVTHGQGGCCTIVRSGGPRGQGRGQGGRSSHRERARADEGEEGSRFLR